MPPRYPIGADAITDTDPRLLAPLHGWQAPQMGQQMGVADAMRDAGALAPSPFQQAQTAQSTPAIQASLMRQAAPRSAPIVPDGVLTMDTGYVGANALDDPQAATMRDFTGRRGGMAPQAMPQPIAPQQRSAPSVSQGAASMNVAPLAQAPTRPAAPASRPPVTMEMRDQAYRKAMRQAYPDMDEQDFEQHVQYGIAKQKERLQYRATKRSVFRLKFRHQYPTMSKEEIEVLVNDAVEDAVAVKDAVEEGLREEAPPSFGGPVMSPPISCTSSRIGSYTYTDCY